MYQCFNLFYLQCSLYCISAFLNCLMLSFFSSVFQKTTKSFFSMNRIILLLLIEAELPFTNKFLFFARNYSKQLNVWNPTTFKPQRGPQLPKSLHCIMRCEGCNSPQLKKILIRNLKRFCFHTKTICKGFLE